MVDFRDKPGLSRDARLLLAAARAQRVLSENEKHELLERFRQTLRQASVVTDEGRSVPNRNQRSWRPTPKALGWAAAALVSTGSLAALASWSGVLPLGPWHSRDPGAPASDSASGVGLERAHAKAPAGHASELNQLPVERDPVAPIVPLPPSTTTQTPAPTTARSDAPAARVSKTSAAPVPPPLARVGPRRLPRSAALPSLEPELLCIMAARDALARNDFAEARRLAAHHEVTFPDGAFLEERAAIVALADCRELGSKDRAEAFSIRWPRSLFAGRLLLDCKLPTNSVPGATPGDTQWTGAARERPSTNSEKNR